MDGGAWWATVHGVTKSWTRLNEFTFTYTPCTKSDTFIICYYYLLYGSDGKESTCNAGDLGSIPGLGRSMEKEMATHSSILAWKNL